MTLQCVLSDAGAKVALLCNGMCLIAIRVADSLNKAFRTLFWQAFVDVMLDGSSERNLVFAVQA